MLVGLNGFGRIGKCIFLLLLDNERIQINAINAPDFDMSKLENYLKHDSVHHYAKDFRIEVVNNDCFRINGRKVYLLRDRNALNLNWAQYGVDTVIDASGCYLTEEKAKQHRVKKLIMSAPAKDDTPLFVYGANDNLYHGESIISNASCTTNSITPVLRHLEEKYNIKNANFTTIHASTASQKVVDTAHSKSRTDRSIFNNIIPHTTGASASIYKVLPTLQDKVIGTSVRVPVNNVSLIDLNVELDSETSLEEIIAGMKTDPYLEVCENNLVSSDFISSTCPSIIDKTACMHLGGNRFKLMVWYDNEWSYANQLIHMCEVMDEYEERNPNFIENVNFKDKNVVLRLDLNLPVHRGKITSDMRLQSALPTIRRILKDMPKRLVIMSHFGRPKGVDMSQSLLAVLPLLKDALGETVRFLHEGLSASTIDTLRENTDRVYLLENLRFHPEETDYIGKGIENEAVSAMHLLGNVYVNDAFGCLHRDHLSICGISSMSKVFGYLIQKELRALDAIVKNPDKKTMAIIGGGKMEDKMELLKNMCKKVDTIYVCGGNMNSLLKKKMDDYLKEISSHRSKIVLMEDGLCARNLEEIPRFKDVSFLDEDEFFYDIGMKSLGTLQKLIQEHDVIFWNGTLGVVEDDKYKKGSELLVQFLQTAICNDVKKQVIVGGGDTGGFVNKYEHNFTHISSGGGASIEYITFDTLVGLKQFE
jgi:glyceraldehyde 3-phosphate dehydrogenase